MQDRIYRIAEIFLHGTAGHQLTGGSKPVMVLDHSAHISLSYHKPVAADETRVETIVHDDVDALECTCREAPTVAYVCNSIYSMGRRVAD